MPSDSPRSTREVSEICRECGTLVGGVEAGDAVRWVPCQSATQTMTTDGRWVCSKPIPASWDWMPRWLRKLLKVPYAR